MTAPDTSAEAARMLLTLDTPIKMLTADGSAPIGIGKWRLPRNDKPGAWMPPITREPVLCERGYHYTTVRHALAHASDRAFLIEVDGIAIHDTTKSVAQRARLLMEIEAWNERNLRLFAADCAERVVHLCGDDPRLRAAIEVARRYARGEATAVELTAAGDATRVATRAATSAAARAATRAAAMAATEAAGAAAEAAARAAGAAEVEWQAVRLLQYLNGEVA